MFYLYTGTDRDRVRSVMMTEVERTAQKSGAEIVRITDAHALDDLRLALAGPGLFGVSRVAVIDGIVANEEMLDFFLKALPSLAESKEPVYFYEEKPLADMRRKLEKYAEKSVRHDAPAKGKDNTIFVLANLLSRGDKKALWVSYQRALAKGDAPEAIHGILFWGAKKMLLSARKDSSAYRKGATFVAELAELPHKSRRKGFELEYALEHCLLSI